MKNAKNLENFSKRGNHAYDYGAFHIDHKFPIIEGYKQNIPPFIMGSLSNLQMIHWKKNISKNKYILDDFDHIDLVNSFYQM